MKIFWKIISYAEAFIVGSLFILAQMALTTHAIQFIFKDNLLAEFKWALLIVITIMSILFFLNYNSKRNRSFNDHI